MIVWLASYPRSGNTLLRIILKESFDVLSYAAVDTSHSNHESLFAKKIGKLSYKASTREAFIEKARQSPDLHFVKTHDEIPAPTDRAIYVVRDGRSSIASYQRFLRDFDKVEFSLAELAKGTRMGFCWSEHVERWMMHDPAHLLVLRYEELSTRPPLAKIARFLNLPIKRPFTISFGELNRIDPRFFGVGRNRHGIDLVERSCSELFWLHNGAVMTQLGYRRGWRYGLRDFGCALSAMLRGRPLPD